MTINIRKKGQNGEKEVAKILNDIVDKVRKERGLYLLESQDKPFQRNQNQSAVGGGDLTNPFGLCIEVKRQENLQIDKWWQQTIIAANRLGETPVLMFKQNRKQWRVIIHTCIISDFTPPLKVLAKVRSEITLPDFDFWFTDHCNNYFKSQTRRIA